MIQIIAIVFVLTICAILTLIGIRHLRQKMFDDTLEVVYTAKRKILFQNKVPFTGSISFYHKGNRCCFFWDEGQMDFLSVTMPDKATLEIGINASTGEVDYTVCYGANFLTMEEEVFTQLYPINTDLQTWIDILRKYYPHAV